MSGSTGNEGNKGKPTGPPRYLVISPGNFSSMSMTRQLSAALAEVGLSFTWTFSGGLQTPSLVFHNEFGQPLASGPAMSRINEVLSRTSRNGVVHRTVEELREAEKAGAKAKSGSGPLPGKAGKGSGTIKVHPGGIVTGPAGMTGAMALSALLGEAEEGGPAGDPHPSDLSEAQASKTTPGEVLPPRKRKDGPGSRQYEQISEVLAWGAHHDQGQTERLPPLLADSGAQAWYDQVRREGKKELWNSLRQSFLAAIEAAAKETEEGEPGGSSP